MKIFKIIILFLLLIHLTGCLYTVNNVKKLEKDERAFGISASCPTLYNNKYSDPLKNTISLPPPGLNLTLLFMQRYLNYNFDYGIIFFAANKSIYSGGGYVLLNLIKNYNYELNSILEMLFIFPAYNNSFIGNKNSRIGMSPGIKMALLRKISKSLYADFAVSFRYPSPSNLPVGGRPT